MMKNYPFVAFLLIVLGIAGCGPLESEEEKKIKENEEEIQKYLTNTGLQAQKTSSGLYYVITPGTGSRKPQTGETVSIHYVFSRLDGYKIDSSLVSLGRPYLFPIGAGINPPGIEEGIQLMKEGDKATLIVPSILGYFNRSFDQLPAYSVIRYDVTLLSTRSEEEQITEYIEKNKLTVTQKTDAGVRIVMTQTNATVALPKAGQLIEVKYKGSLLRDIRKVVSGQVIYESTFDSGTFSFNLGGNVVAGFNEGISKLRVGEKAKLIFPSSLGYGTSGSSSGVIPPYTPLAFDVEVLSVQ